MADREDHSRAHLPASLTLNSTSDNEQDIHNIQPGLPSPPYRRYPTSLYDDAQQTPPYKSQSQVNIHLMTDNGKGKSPEQSRSEPDSLESHTNPVPKRSVHYPSDLKQPFASKRAESSDNFHTHHKAPSIASYDDFDDEDYDWSTEDDLVDEEIKNFEKEAGLRKKTRSRTVRIFSFFLSTLIGSVLTASILVAGALLVHFFYYEKSGDAKASRQYTTQNIEAWLFWAASNLVVSWFLAFIINLVPAVFTWIIFIAWGQISESMKNRVALYNSMKGSIKPVFYGASAWLSWTILFSDIYKLYNAGDPDSSNAHYTVRVYQAIEFVFFISLVLSVQKMVSHMIAFTFHKVAFKDRMDALKLGLRTVDHLKKYKPRHSHRSSRVLGGFMAPLTFGLVKTPGATPYNEKSHFLTSSRSETPDIDDDGHTGDSEDNSPMSSKKGKAKQKRVRVNVVTESMSGTATPASRSGSPITESPARTLPVSGQLYTNAPPMPTVDTQHTYPPTSTSSNGLSPNRSGEATPTHKSSESDGDGVMLHAAKALKTAVLHDARNIAGKEDEEGFSLGWSVGSAQEAKRLARSIYQAFRADRRRNYLVAEDFYPAYATEEEAREAFRVFDVDNNGDISRAEIKTTIVRLYRERRFLSRSMRDVSTALRSLNQVLFAFALIILALIGLSVFQAAILNSLTSLYTLVVAASFVFKQSASNMFDAIMFLFVTHPFDTGDRCFIGDENLVVKKMGLFATVFTRSDGSETYYSNSMLFTMFITNARRSAKTAELCTLQIAWRTPLWKIDELEKRINEWLSTEENRWFEPSTSITLQKIENQRYLEITIGIPHNSNWQDWGLRNARKTAVYAAANYYCRQLGITCVNSTLPIKYVNATNPNAPDGQEPFAASPMSATRFGLDDAEQEDDASAQDVKAMRDLKPMLGFLPPPDKRSSKLLKPRKSKGRKGGFRGVDGG